MAPAAPKLLADEQVRRFITDGFLILSPDVPELVHQRIDERLLWMVHNENNPGNNVLPMVPEMYDVLNCSVVHGALASILGWDYALHPHRFVHNNEPGKIDESGVAKVGAGSASFVGWHQDDHSPLSRPRHHYPRYAMILYYPQDTPVERGPTQLIPATHFSSTHSNEDKMRGLQAAGPAGTCVLAHFDIVHGGSLNTSDRTRNMAKFVFARCSEPVSPSWDNRVSEWISPAEHLSPVENDTVWRHQWEWLSGRKPTLAPTNLLEPGELSAVIDQYDSRHLQRNIDAANQLGCSDSLEAINALLSLLVDEEPLRQAAIYSLANIGAAAVKPLSSHLESIAEELELAGEPCGWNEGAVVMEDFAYALAAIGGLAVPELVSLLQSSNEWVRINAVFALGEMGAQASAAIPSLIKLLHDESHSVVRTALDAIGQIRVGSSAALPEIKRLLASPRSSFPESWTAPQRRKWACLDQVRLNAVMALLRMGAEANGAEVWLGEFLDDDCGYVGGFGIEYLLRRNSAAAQDAVIDYLYRHRWDNTLRVGVRTY